MVQKIRVLIIDDIEETVFTVKKWLSTVSDITVVATATNARDGIQLVHKYQPDVVLMDVFMHTMDGLEAAQIITTDTPARVILMSVEMSPEAMQSAMRARAMDYLKKPLDMRELVRAIHDAAYAPASSGVHQMLPVQSPPQLQLGQYGQHIIAVCGMKGGTGRSVIATNIAVALAQQKHKVVLLDGNLQSGDTHYLLSMDSPQSLDHLRDRPELDLEVIEKTVIRHESGIYFLRAPHDVASADAFTAEVMKGILTEVREHFDYVIVDTDNRYTDATMATFEIADTLLVVTTPEITAVYQTSVFFTTLERWPIPLDKCWMICNRFDGGYQIKPSHMERTIGRRFHYLLPDDARTVIYSVNHGIPFVLKQRRAAITRAIQDLAKKLHQSFAVK